MIAQSPYMLRGDQAYQTYDRLEILRLSDTSLVNGINNYDRKELVKFLNTVSLGDQLTGKDIYDLRHIYADNIEFLDHGHLKEENTQEDESIFRSATAVESDHANVQINHFYTYASNPLLKYFYATKANFLQLETPSFKMYINPVVQLTYFHESNNDQIVFQNTRGVDIRGYIDNKVYFYTQLLENQRSYLSYVNDRISKFGSLPGQGFWKNYQSGIIDNLKGYDFFNARAYIGFNPVKSINVEFGHGNHFLGNGYRSLLLSDFSTNYLYLKLNTRIWKFQYQNIFAELAPISTLVNVGDQLLPKKYSATHYLAFKPNTKFEIGLFESVIFARENHFEFQYLNPVILYRAVEHALDSPDNVMIGLNLKWNVVKGISLYGQLLADEFKLSEVKKQSGWWANKFGGQFGIKYINAFGIDHLDLQLEYNSVRPYTYAHRDTLAGHPTYSVANYSTYNQPLAHPLGANFKEIVFLLRYKPTDRLYVMSKMLMTTYGDDRPGENWGSNILLPLESREQDYGNVIGQGLKTKIFAFYTDISYEFYHNYFVDLQGMYRQTTTDLIQNQNYIGGGLRINISNIHYDY